MVQEQGRRDERGMTLVELMIAFLLTDDPVRNGDVSYRPPGGDTTSADTRIRLNSEAQLVMDAITRQVRAATYAAMATPPLDRWSTPAATSSLSTPVFCPTRSARAR